MKNIIKAALALTFACGSPDPAYEYDDLGNVKQELITQVSNTTEAGCLLISGAMFESNPFQGLTYGAQTCMDSTKTIYVPRSKTVVLQPQKGICTDQQYTDMKAQIDVIVAELNTAASLGGAGTSWVFSRSASGTHPVVCADVPTSPVGPNSIRNFVRTRVPAADAIPIFDSDSVADGANFAGWSALTIQVDVPAIYAKGASAAEDTRMLWQALAHGIGPLTGTGEYPGNRMAASDTDISGATGRVMFSNGERCRARNFAVTQTSNMFHSSSANCPEN